MKDEERKVKSYGNNEMENTSINILNSGIQVEISSDSDMYQQRDKLDIEIDETCVGFLRIYQQNFINQ